MIGSAGRHVDRRAAGQRGRHPEGRDPGEEGQVRSSLGQRRHAPDRRLVARPADERRARDSGRDDRGPPSRPGPGPSRPGRPGSAARRRRPRRPACPTVWIAPIARPREPSGHDPLEERRADDLDEEAAGRGDRQGHEAGSQRRRQAKPDQADARRRSNPAISGTVSRLGRPPGPSRSPRAGRRRRSPRSGSRCRPGRAPSWPVARTTVRIPIPPMAKPAATSIRARPASGRSGRRSPVRRRRHVR